MIPFNSDSTMYKEHEMVSQTRRKKKRNLDQSNVQNNILERNVVCKPSVKQPLFTVKRFGSFKHEIMYEIKAVSHPKWVSRTMVETEFGWQGIQILDEFEIDHKNESPVEFIGIVSLVINDRLDEDGNLEYLVQYKDGAVRYEPVVNLEGCEWHIEQFHTRQLMVEQKEREIREERKKMEIRVAAHKRPLPANEAFNGLFVLLHSKYFAFAVKTYFANAKHF